MAEKNNPAAEALGRLGGLKGGKARGEEAHGWRAGENRQECGGRGGGRGWAERMMRIHKRLSLGGYPNRTTLAKEIGVCTRTVMRDIDFMNYRLEMPIEYECRRYGFYYTAKAKHSPGVRVTEADRLALLAAQKAMTPYRGGRGRR